MFNETVKFIRNYYGEQDDQIPLHAPLFVGNERKYVLETIDSTFVSSVGKFVDQFENSIKKHTGADFAVATVNGTCALQIALQLAGVKPGDLVITQALTFISTCNAIAYCQAKPIFIDIDLDTLGLSPLKVRNFISQNCYVSNGQTFHKQTNKKIAACLPMHTFGHPVRMDELIEVCAEFNIPVVEDAAESLGSLYKDKHTGTFGLVGIFSFNGNKTITCGGGGVIVTNDERLGKMAKHLTTQAKKPHPWDFVHDYIGYNYRMPNINAALGCAQLEMLDKFIDSKRELATAYRSFFGKTNMQFVNEPANCRSNFWLNAILLNSRQERDAFLQETNNSKVMTRPCWTLMNKLEMFKNEISDDLTNSSYIEDRLINIPSSPKL